MMSGNAYNMDISKTGNEFIAYVPEGMNVDVWEYAKQQNRESQVNPLLGFAFENELDSQEEDFLSEEDVISGIYRIPLSDELPRRSISFLKKKTTNFFWVVGGSKLHLTK